MLHILHDPPLDGSTNMARDEHLLYSDDLRPAALRLYAWTPPTISLGYFQSCAELARLPEDVRGLATVRRITGGGAILHDREITYCLVLDASVPVAATSPIALYRLVHECWRTTLGRDGPQVELAPDDFPTPTPRGGPFFCFEKPGRADLIVRNEKLLGSAQRRIPGRVLQHGSLLLGRRFSSHPGADLGQPPAAVVAAWTSGFIEQIASALALQCQPTDWTAQQLADVQQRRERYADAGWTQRR